MSIRFIGRTDGTTVAVKVVPGSRKHGIKGPLGDRLKVAVASAPEKGRANKALCQVLASELDVPAGRVRVLSGDTSPLKTVLLEGVSVAEARRALS